MLCFISSDHLLLMVYEHAPKTLCALGKNDIPSERKGLCKQLLGNSRPPL